MVRRATLEETAAVAKVGAENFTPKDLHAPLPVLREAADHCRGCDLYKNATQVVFGEPGIPAAQPRAPKVAVGSLMLVGEQPGDQEDQTGHPFVGPAGKLLDQALADAGIDRAHVYVTNAVKHFKWTPAPRGKRRIHAKPNAAEVRACRPWLEREIALVKPPVIVTLGATAGQSLFGASFRVGASRGKAISGSTWGGWSPRVVATVHPSAILRMPDREAADREFKALVHDLKVAKKEMAK